MATNELYVGRSMSMISGAALEVVILRRLGNIHQLPPSNEPPRRDMRRRPR